MSSVKSAEGNASLLTVIMPTRNRPAHCATQLRFFRSCGLGYRILVADSSDPEQAEKVRNACQGIADYQYYDPALRIIDKWALLIKAVDTPYVVMTPDDDITFPHAIDAALAALTENADYVAAHGYVLNFGMHDNYFDIHSVFSFTPTIDSDDALRRHYQLMRRYQPFIWAVFRTPAFAAALNAAAKINGTIFQELTFMNVALLHGKVMRLGMVYAMRGSEESLSLAVDVDPFAWYLKDADQFFVFYTAYRNALAQSIRSMSIAIPEYAGLEQFLDIAHGTWLGREIDLEKIDDAERRILSEDLPAIPFKPQWSGWRPLEKPDLVHGGAADSREYVWREAVNAAKPREEIVIEADEMARVERQLDFYKPLNHSMSSP